MSRNRLDCLGSQTSLPESPVGHVDNYDKKCQLSTICLGKGSIWVAKHRQTGHLLAIKIYELDRCVKEFERIQSEVVTVRQLNHPNILNHYGSFIYEDELHIYMPLVGYRSAASVVASYYPEGLEELSLGLITKDVLQGIHYLHSKGIIHRSIRGSHILIESSGRCLLSGFRNATWCSQEGKRTETIHSYPEEAPFSLNWESPEVLKQDIEGYNSKTDIYSLGITLCELGNAEVPYCRLEPQLMLVEKVYGREPCLYDMNTLPVEENGKDSGVGGSYGDCLSSLPKTTEKQFSPLAHQFVAGCLSVEASWRPSAEKLLHHPFIRQTKKYSGILASLLPLDPIDERTDLSEFETDFLVREMAEVRIDDDLEWDL